MLETPSDRPAPELPSLPVEELLGLRLPERLSDRLWGLRRLARRLQKAPFDRARIAALATFDDDRYARRTLLRDSRWEVAIIGWLPGQRTAIHDHGTSLGLTLVLGGELVETRFRARRNGALRDGRDRRLTAGDVLLEPGAWIHRVENRSASAAVSLHLYAPPLASMATYPEPFASPSSRLRSMIGAAGVLAALAAIRRLLDNRSDKLSGGFAFRRLASR